MVKEQGKENGVVIETNDEVIGGNLIGSREWVVYQKGKYNREEIEKRIESEKKLIQGLYPMIAEGDIEGYIDVIDVVEQEGEQIYQINCVVDIYKGYILDNGKIDIRDINNLIKA